MSLGIRQCWRAPQSNVVRKLLAIPRLRHLSVPTRSFSSLRSPLNAESSAHNDHVNAELASPPTLRRKGLLDRLALVPVRARNAHDPVLIPPVAQYPNKRETHIAHQRRHKAIEHQKYLEKERAINNTKGKGDWRLTLRRLYDSTPEETIQCSANRAKIFVLDKDSSLRTPAGESFIAKSQSEAGCAVVDWVDGEDTPCLLLRGSTTGVQGAINRILREDNNVKVVDCSGSTDITLFDAGVPPVPGTWDTLTEGFRTLLAEDVWFTKDDVGQIPVPPEWQPSSLLDYVKTLIQSRMRRAWQRGRYANGMTHDEAVSRRLQDVFCVEVPDSALTTEAVNLALAQMCRGNIPCSLPLRFFSKIAPRVLFDTHTYHILLDMISRNKDLVEFHKRLVQMLRAGLKPTFYTWVLFLRLVEHEEVRRYILHSMRDKNLLLARGSMAIISHEMIEHDMYRAVKLGQSLDTFLASQNDLYGPDWLNVRSATRLLDVLGRYGSFQDMVRIVDMVFPRDPKESMPTTRALSLIMVHCERWGSARFAKQFLDMFEERGTHLDDIGWGALFKLMLRKYKPHQASIVWRYALLSGKTTYIMRKRAAELLSNKRTAPVPRVVRHLNDQNHHLPPQLHKFLVQLVGYEYWQEDPDALQRLKSASSRTKEAQVMADLIAFYHRLATHWLPMWPLSVMLRQAEVMDRTIFDNYRSSRVASPLMPLHIRFIGKKIMEEKPQNAKKVSTRSKLAKMMLGPSGYCESYRPLRLPADYHPKNSLGTNLAMATGQEEGPNAIEGQISEGEARDSQ